MYEQTFQFSSRPFNSVPRIEDFFAGLSYKQAIDVAHMCVDRSNGPVVVVGAVGMGKSLLLQKIGQSFESRFDVVHIECSRLEARSELLQSILFGLNLPYAGLSEGELRFSLMAYLKEGRGADDGVLLLVDEADSLSVALIDELRLITNQIRDGRSLVQLVLAGTQRLEESLADAKLASFNQRIAARCVLQNLSKRETQQFVFQHIEQAGRSGDEIFGTEAIDEIFSCSDGCPRLINQLCDQSLLLAASRNQLPVDRPLIREAWAEMQNMPMPAMGACEMGAHATNATASDESSRVVEFGQLGDTEAACQSSEDCCVADAQDTQHSPASDPSIDAVADEVAEEQGQESETSESDGEATATSEADESSPQNSHAAAAALAAAAFAANAARADPFAPQDGDVKLEDGNSESERIASLEQEQDELFEQARAQDDSSADEVRSAFDVLGLNEQGAEPPVVDDMIPADPFHVADEHSDSNDQTNSSEGADTFSASQTSEAPVEGLPVDPPETSEGPSPMAQCSIEEQLGLVETVAAEPTTFHTPPSEAHALSDATDSYSLQHLNGDTNQEAETESQPPQSGIPTAESSDPFAEPFEEEEMLQDAYSPFVAEQNQASLGVTADQLSQLQPLDAEDSDGDSSSNHWNSQTPELAIEELDVLGVSTDLATPSDISGEQGDFTLPDSAATSATADLAADAPSALPPNDLWQNNKESAWDPSQYQMPSEISSETPASFEPVPSVPTELESVPISLDEPSAFSQDPFAPQDNGEPIESEAHEPSQPEAAPPTDEDLEALTSDLDAVTTFDLHQQQYATEGEAQPLIQHPPRTSGGLMDLNDLVPSHLLPQMEAQHAQQNNFSADSNDDIHQVTEDNLPTTAAGHESNDLAAPGQAGQLDQADQPGEYAAPYSAHAAARNAQTPESIAQAEARRKTEEFMRNFQAQREVESSESPEQIQPAEPTVAESTVAESPNEHPHGQSQEILKEIFSQQQILDQVHYTDAAQDVSDQSEASDHQNQPSFEEQGADSVSIETPVTNFEGYQQSGAPPTAQDDRDMLYVTESQQYSPPETAEPPQSPPFPTLETSTGNAQRMDYNQLFEQLRNPSTEQ